MGIRNDAYNALFNLVSQGEGQPGRIDWGGGRGFQFTSRRVRMWDQYPAKPALSQLEPGEITSASNSGPDKLILMAEWWIFMETAPDADVIPAIEVNDMLDALAAAIAPPPYETQNRQTLGGLVYNARIEGTVVKVPGDIEGQALIIVPVQITLP